MTIVVLWEDSTQRGTTPRDFAPHLLAIACLADRLGRDPWTLRKDVEANPTNGIDKLLDKARNLRARRVVAVPDADKIRQHLALGANVADAVVMNRLSQLAPNARFVLLRRNMEDVLVAVAAALGQLPPTSKLKPRERDELIAPLLNPSLQAKRAIFLERMPSFHDIVDAIAAAINQP